MFYDLNVPWSANDTQLPRTLAFLHELGYSVVALNHTISGKLPTDLSCPIPSPLPHTDLPKGLTILRRCTLVLTDSHQNARLAELSRNYDILALRPIDERSFQLACTSLDCDIISLDLTQRLPFYFKYSTLNEAVRNGKRFEICYAQAVSSGSSDGGRRRNLISNATQLIRASRGRGLVLSSEARSAVACRGPWDAINLSTIWGLGQERGYEAMSKECRSVVVGAGLKRTGWRGVVDVVFGGEKPAPTVPEKLGEGKGKQAANGQKGKAEVVKDHGNGAAIGNVEVVEKPVSKRQKKKLAHEARQKAAAQVQDTIGNAVAGAESAAAYAQRISTAPNAKDGDWEARFNALFEDEKEKASVDATVEAIDTTAAPNATELTEKPVDGDVQRQADEKAKQKAAAEAQSATDNATTGAESVVKSAQLEPTRPDRNHENWKARFDALFKDEDKDEQAPATS